MSLFTKFILVLGASLSALTLALVLWVIYLPGAGPAPGSGLWLGLAGLALLSVAVGALTLWTLNRLVLTRLRQLSAAVSQIEAGADETARVPAAGQDEVAALAAAINRLLATLARGRLERKHAEAEIQALARFPEESPAPILRLDADGVVIYTNQAGRELIQALGSATSALDHVISAWQAPVAQALQTRTRLEIIVDAGERSFACLFVAVPEAGYVNVYGRDITASRRAEQALQQERDFALQVMNTMGQGLTVLDADGRFEYVNPAYAAMLGCQPDELIGRSPFEVTLAGDHDQLAGAMTLRRAGHSNTYETRLRRRDGGTVPVLITGVPGAPTSRVRGAIAVITDLTERRAAEEQLRDNEEKYRQLIANLTDGVSMVDEQGRLVEWNAAQAAITGVDRAAVLGRPLWEVQIELTPPEHRTPEQVEQLRAAVQRLHQTGEFPDASRRRTLALLRPDGVQRMIEAVSYPFQTRTGWAMGSLTRDITERVRLEQAMRDSEARYRLLFEESPVSLWEEDITGIRAKLEAWRQAGVADFRAFFAQQPDRLLECQAALRIVDVNQATLQLYRAPDKPTLLASFARILPVEAIESFRELVLTIAAGRSELDWEGVNYTLAGERLDIQLRFYLPGRDASRVLVSILDITARKQAEHAVTQLNQVLEQRVQERTAALEAANRALQAERAQLAQRVAERTADLSAANAELAQAARAKDEFLASMSHELRTPLNTILGMTELLQEELYGPNNPEQRECLRSVDESGRHLLALINDILDVSKIEANRLELQFDLVEVAAVCQASLRLVKEAAHKKRQTLTVTLDPAVALVRADERRLKQMLVNLLSNAGKFTPEGGRLGLEVRGDHDREQVRFTVWDTGIGIAPEDQARLFKPFVQLDSRLARQYAGTGLGLSLVRRMAELHGGGVELESALDQGSRFTLILPWNDPAGPLPAEPADAAEPPAPPEPAGDRGPRVLVADDNEANLRLLTRALGAHRYEVHVAHNGLEAVALAGALRPAVMIMDIQLPELDGLEAMRRIRQQPALAETHILALTALAMAGDRERCLAAGADEYLSKPVSPKVLLRTLAALLARRAPPPALAQGDGHAH
ncbi:MAG: PAS domain S-box protein [Anaerolineales bacterium]|nr:PAS domain S-box protein [Anaerolineales bacterium]